MLPSKEKIKRNLALANYNMLYKMDTTASVAKRLSVAIMYDSKNIEGFKRELLKTEGWFSKKMDNSFVFECGTIYHVASRIVHEDVLTSEERKILFKRLCNLSNLPLDEEKGDMNIIAGALDCRGVEFESEFLTKEERDTLLKNWSKTELFTGMVKKLSSLIEAYELKEQMGIPQERRVKTRVL